MKTFKNSSKYYEKRITLECMKRIVLSLLLVLSFLKLYEVSSKSQSNPAVETKTTKYVESNIVADDNSTELSLYHIDKHFTFNIVDIHSFIEAKQVQLEFHSIPYITLPNTTNIIDNGIALTSLENEFEEETEQEETETSPSEVNIDEEFTMYEGLLNFQELQLKNNKETQEETSEEIVEETELIIPTVTDYVDKYVYNDIRKSYMSWDSISVPSSRQWAIQYTYAYTDEYTGMRLVDNHYLIAMGSYYTHNIGQYVDVYLENGVVIPCIIGDAKSDLHTNAEHTHGLDGSVVEFMVDPDALPEYTRITGDISNLYESWNSKVVMVRLYNKNLFE